MKTESSFLEIEIFAERFFELLEAANSDSEKIKNLLQNLKIVTLNYDRAFDYRFYGIVQKRLQSILTKPREFQKHYEPIFEKACIVYHPHGSLGGSGSKEFSIPHSYTYLNRNSLPGIDYGNSGDLRRSIDQGIMPPILPVDDLLEADNGTYNEVNNFLNNSRYAICIGLSENGIKNSALDFSKIDKVYYSGNTKVEDNFEPLNLRASEIIEML